MSSGQSGFRAMLVEKTDDGFTRRLVERDTADLPEGDVLIDVGYSSLNYKDALSATGNPGVTRKFPHTPGIDAAGVVAESTSDEFKAGDEVIVIGYDLGMNTPGGFAQRIRVPAGWVVARPQGLPLHQSTVIGTAGFTAALCVDKLENAGMTPDGGPVLVTGATGGVGCVAVMLLGKLGYEVAAVTGKEAQHDFLRSLGASSFLSREEAREGGDRPLLKERWGGVVDTVGGEILSIPATVLPFILRNVNLLGVDSVELPRARKAEVWQKLAGPWRLDGLEELEEPLTLDTLSAAIDRILAGDMVGRGVVDLNA